MANVGKPPSGLSSEACEEPVCVPSKHCSSIPDQKIFLENPTGSAKWLFYSCNYLISSISMLDIRPLSPFLRLSAPNSSQEPQLSDQKIHARAIENNLNKFVNNLKLVFDLTIEDHIFKNQLSNNLLQFDIPYFTLIRSNELCFQGQVIGTRKTDSSSDSDHEMGVSGQVVVVVQEEEPVTQSSEKGYDSFEEHSGSDDDTAKPWSVGRRIEVDD